MLTKKKKPTLAIDNLDRRLTEYETSRKQHSLESDYDKEIKFEKLRNARKEYNLKRPPRHPWWHIYDDHRVQNVWNRECLYFPADNPTQEERNFYEYVVQNYINKKEHFHFHLNSTKEAFWQWYHDELTLQSDRQHFPEHQHGDHDFFMDQLEDQDYYYNRKIFGPIGWSQTYLFEKVHHKEQEEYDRKEMAKRKRRDHE